MKPLPNLVPTGERRHAKLGELYRTAAGLVLRAEKEYECSYDVDIYREEASANMTRDEAGAVFGYVESGEVRLPKRDEWYFPVRSYAGCGVVQAIADHAGKDGSVLPIARPLIRGRDVVVDAKMLERLREKVGLHFENKACVAYCAARDFLASLPPAAPADPLKSTEFVELLDAYAAAKGTDVIGVVGQIRDYLRENAAGIAAAAKEAT